MTETVTARPSGQVSWGGWAALAGVAIPLAGQLLLPIWTFPATTAGGDDVVAFVGEHQAALQTVMVANAVGVALWLVFGAAVWARLRAALPAASMIPACFAAGLIGFVTLLFAGFTSFDVLVYRQPDPAVAQVLYDLAFGMLAMSGMPTAVALVAYAVAVYRYGVLPRRTGHVAVAAAVSHVVLLLSFIVSAGFFSLEGAVISVIPALLFAWIAETGSCLVRGR